MRAITFSLLLTGLLSTLAFSSCQKEGFLTPVSGWDSTGSTTGSGSSDTTTGGGATVGTNSGNYQPTTKGSTWTYSETQSLKFNASSTGLTDAQLTALMQQYGISLDTTFSFTISALGTDTTIEGATFSIFSTTQTGGNGYIRVNNGEYSAYGSLLSAASDDSYSTEGFALLYLKDKPVNTSWTQVIPVSGQNLTYTYTIKAVGTTKKIGSTTYKDVIQIQQAGGVSGSLPTGVSIPTVQYYYAKNIGQIAMEYNYDVMGYASMTVNAYLQTADIK